MSSDKDTKKIEDALKQLDSKRPQLSKSEEEANKEDRAAWIEWLETVRGESKSSKARRPGNSK